MIPHTTFESFTSWYPRCCNCFIMLPTFKHVIQSRKFRFQVLTKKVICGGATIIIIAVFSCRATLYLVLSVCLSVSLSVCLFVCLSQILSQILEKSQRNLYLGQADTGSCTGEYKQLCARVHMCTVPKLSS